LHNIFILNTDKLLPKRNKTITVKKIVQQTRAKRVSLQKTVLNKKLKQKSSQKSIYLKAKNLIISA